jgi:hypothetical protein
MIETNFTYKVNDDSHPSPMQLVSEENTALPRQRGCEGYEALAKVEKIDVRPIFTYDHLS